ncbi:MAG: chemotaxis protein CheW [Gemmatimonadaceae bacterium]
MSASSSSAATHAGAGAGAIEYVTFRLADQWLGIPVLLVQEVLLAQRIARVPRTPEEVAGFLNLRGQIVTAVELRTRLGLPPRDPEHAPMNVVVRHEGELFSLLVDEVGDVLSVEGTAVEPPPPTLDPTWRQACAGIVRRERGLLVVVHVHALLRLELAAA